MHVMPSAMIKESLDQVNHLFGFQNDCLILPGILKEVARDQQVAVIAGRYPLVKDALKLDHGFHPLLEFLHNILNVTSSCLIYRAMHFFEFFLAETENTMTDLLSAIAH